MPKVPEAAPHGPVVEENVHAHGWEHTLQAALAVLREIDARL
jgi:hypothetical protein